MPPAPPFRSPPRRRLRTRRGQGVRCRNDWALPIKGFWVSGGPPSAVPTMDEAIDDTPCAGQPLDLSIPVREGGTVQALEILHGGRDLRWQSVHVRAADDGREDRETAFREEDAGVPKAELGETARLLPEAV